MLQNKTLHSCDLSLTADFISDIAPKQKSHRHQGKGIRTQNAGFSKYGPLYGEQPRDWNNHQTGVHQVMSQTQEVQSLYLDVTDYYWVDIITQISIVWCECLRMTSGHQ